MGNNNQDVTELLRSIKEQQQRDSERLARLETRVVKSMIADGKIDELGNTKTISQKS